MADVFLSYSRRDGEFVRRLTSALESRGKEAWVDVEGVRDAEVFPEALRRAIETSEAFVFVISPDAVKSAFCVEEIEHAASLNKRIVPLALRPVPDEQIPEEVRFRNWIPGGEQDGEFEGVVERLVKALDTDLEWEREHSRLTVRALEWERSGRDRSSLLRGSELRSAETWLAAGADKDPGPTALETQYLSAARRATARRQRGLVATSLVVAAISIGLLIFALISRSDAINQALTSDSERVGAQALVEKNLDLAMLYAVTGVKLQNRVETRSDLLAELQNNPDVIKVIRPSSDDILSLAIDPRRPLLATGDSAGIVRFEDTSDWKSVGAPLRLQGQLPSEAMTFSSAGALAVVTEGGTAQGNIQAGLTRLYQIGATTHRARLLGSWRGVVPSVPGPGPSVAYDPTGRHIALAIATSAPSGTITGETLRLLDSSTGRQIWRRRYPLRPGQQPAVVKFAPDGELLTSAPQGYTLEWNAHTGRVVRRFPIGGEPAISPDGKTVALALNSPSLATPTSRIALLNLRGGHYRVLAAGAPENWVRDLAFIAGGTEIIGNLIHSDVEVWDVASGSIAESIAAPLGSRNAVTVDPAGRTLAIGAGDGSVIVSDLEGSRRLGQAFEWAPPTQSCPYAPCFVVNRQSKLMATDESNGSVAVINLRTLRLTAKLPARNGVLASALAFFPDGRTLVTGGLTGYLTFWDVDSHRVVRRIHLGEPVWWVDVSRDGRLLAAQTQAAQSSSSQVQVRPAAGGQPLWTHAVPDGNGGLYFSPDGREVAALGCCTATSTIVSWDARSGRQLFERRLANHATVIAYIPHSQLLAVGTEDGHVLFWNARRGVEQGPPLLITAGTISGLTFSPDGKTMVVSADDGSTTVWDLRSRTQIGNSFPIRPEVVTEPVFEPNGRLLMDYLADAEQWPMDVGSWERFACQVAGRNLTHGEWRAILPDRPYMRVCPKMG